MMTEEPTPVTETPQPPHSEQLSGKLAYWLHLGSEHKVYVIQLPGGETLRSVACARQPNLSRDGTRLVVNGQGCGLDSLRVMNADGSGGEVEASYYNESAHPSWSPDGTHLAYDDGNIDPRGWYIYVQKPGPYPDINKTPLTAGGVEIVRGGNPLFPVWTEDDRIAFSGCATWENPGECGIWIMSLSGEIPTRLAGDGNIPTDSAAGKLLYMSNSSGNWEIYSAGLGGGQPVNLTNNGAADGLGTFSPDGGKVAFLSDRGGWAIWVMNADGTDQHKIYDFPKEYGSVDTDCWVDERMSWRP